MAGVRVIFFKELDGTVPLIDWLESLQEKRARSKCLALVKLLSVMGHDLRRPRSDALRAGIRELRTEAGHVNYRILYFFYGKDCVVLSHGLTKDSSVPDSEINKAIERKTAFASDPDKHTFYETNENDEET
jgi:phage-related protein